MALHYLYSIFFFRIFSVYFFIFLRKSQIIDENILLGISNKIRQLTRLSVCVSQSVE